MNYRQLGRAGLRVSELCLGAMTFGREATEEDSLDILDRFVEVGGNFIDTADVYADGKSEEILGRWFKGKRNLRFISTPHQERECQCQSYCAERRCSTQHQNSHRTDPVTANGCPGIMPSRGEAS